jgi:hypothetical protein
MAGRRPPEKVGVRLRVEVGPERGTPFVELDLDQHTTSLTPAQGRAIASGLVDMADAADRFLAEQDGRLGPEPLPELRRSTDLHLHFEAIVHDGDRHELLHVVAARIESLLRREGAEVCGWDGHVEPSIVERFAAEEAEASTPGSAGRPPAR